MNTPIIPPSAPAGQVVFLSVEVLKLHPQNMRVYYPPQGIAKMADSIKAANGVYQALLVVEDDTEPGTYLVMDGNMRLAGGRLLGSECPLLKCEIVTADRAEQLLAMAIPSEFHFPKDVVSQGFHYARLMEQEGFSVVEIASQTGVSRVTIEKALKTIQLEPEIRELITEGKLSGDLRVTRALLELPDSDTRIRQARRFARSETGIKGIQQACRFIVRQHAALAGGTTLVERVEAIRAKKELFAAKVQATKTANAQAARSFRLDPAAAELISRAAGQTLCDDCRIDGLTEQCYLCPGPRDFINAVIELIEPAEPAEPKPETGNGHIATEKDRLMALGQQLREDLTGRRAA